MGCVHFPDDDHSVCSICKPKPVFDPWAPVNPGGGRSKEAEYHGTCAVCGNTIYPGDPIRSYRDGWGHEDCVERRERSRRL